MFDKIEALLEKHNITLNKLSKEVGLPYMTLKNWKLRGSSPRLENVKKIADYFGVPLEYFFEKGQIVVNITNTGGNNEINGIKTVNDLPQEVKNPIKKNVVEVFDQLTDKGQKKLLEHAELLLGKYKK